ncbi:5-formyltetrahydrofolate cyclo-ligase [Paenibacillus sp. DXFW5]|uniref:5-formyltetrahydrofolate cyclo-ligase n=1 Tax=Paenibacillus rhizolycopersici TaxID=2780073 RepID=A0ABS2H367_9BACL|nr:5-formyltetrahydrofolate cyclo-ligase [Paenibacillus rhizolycopersici]MBM6994364.1 5-formyltetrahydrofolate cyclo-ligase [Paenibacillus rhizolycopersici]
MEFMDAKKELRQRMLKVRAQIPEGSRLEQSLAAGRIAEREVLSPLRARRGGKLNLFCYVAFRDEPDTWPLLANGLAQGDRLLTPRIGPERSLSLHEISGMEDLVPGTWGIREPAGHTAVWPPERYPEIDVIVVPGLAFDRNGGRIGFGAGYYDRLIDELSRLSGGTDQVVLAALVLQELILPEGAIPMEPHDFRLDLLLTAKETIYMKESSDKLDNLGIGSRNDAF